MQMFRRVRRQVAGLYNGECDGAGRAVFEETYVPDPGGTIVLLNPDDANRVFLVESSHVAAGSKPSGLAKSADAEPAEISDGDQ